jgi:tetratricopeptide (TPR) repeat protein
MNDAKLILSTALDLHRSGNLEAAKKGYEEVLRIDPRNADALHLLGIVHKMRGDIELAIREVSSAIMLSPNNALFYGNLGACYLEKVTEDPAAELCLKKALELDKESPDPWNNLGVLFTRGRRYPEAASALNRALNLNPDSAKTLCDLGWLAYTQGDHAEAERFYKKALEKNPAYANAIVGMAKNLVMKGMYNEALNWIESAKVSDAISQASLMAVKGRSLEIIGKTDEACAAFDRAIEINPEDIEPIILRANLKKIENESLILQHVRKLIPKIESVVGIQKTGICYAVGKSYEDTGDVARAAHYYAIGSVAALASQSYDEMDQAKCYDEMREHCNSTFLDNLEGQGDESDCPIFIVGMPRSGTTLVEQILGSHPDVFPGGELELTKQVLSNFPLTSNLVLYSTNAPKNFSSLTTLKERAFAYLEGIHKLMAGDRRRHFTNKMPTDYLVLGIITKMFPHAKIIHCRRDPLDTSLSCYTTHFASQHEWAYDFNQLGREYRRYWDLMNHWRNVVPGTFLEVRYEELVDNPEMQARRLLDWCGLEWNSRVLHFYETSRPVVTASVSQVRRPIYKSSKNRWKKWQPYIEPLINELRDIEVAYWSEVGHEVTFDNPVERAEVSASAQHPAKLIALSKD